MMQENILERASHLPVLSLKELALIRLTTILCNNQELMRLITKCVFSKLVFSRISVRNEKSYKNVQAKANDLLSEMLNIGMYKDMILEWLWPVTYRIILWKTVYTPIINEEFLPHFYWTYRGKIDSQRTAKYIIENKLIPIEKQFILACSLCLFKEIHEIWKDMSSYDMVWLFTEDNEYIRPFLLFWTHVLVESNDMINETFDEAFDCAVKIGSLEAIKFLFSTLSENEKSDKAILCLDIISQKIICSGFLEEEESDIGYFVISQMTDRNKEIFLSTNYMIVLSLLLYSSGQKEFLKLLEDSLYSVSVNDMQYVLSIIFYKYHLDVCRDYNYYQLFVQAWKKLEVSLKVTLRKESNLGIICLRIWLMDGYGFILKKGVSKQLVNLGSADIDKRNSAISFFSKHKKLELMFFVIEEKILRMRSLKIMDNAALNFMQTKLSKQIAWIKIVRFLVITNCALQRQKKK